MASRERHPVRVVAGLLLALAVTAGWLTASARAESHAYRLDYQGSYAWHDDFKEAAGFAHTTETLTWNWLMYAEEGSHGTSTSSSKLSAQGTLEEEGSSTPPEHCTITQASPSPKVGLRPAFVPGPSPTTSRYPRSAAANSTCQATARTVTCSAARARCCARCNRAARSVPLARRRLWWRCASRRRARVRSTRAPPKSGRVRGARTT